MSVLSDSEVKVRTMPCSEDDDSQTGFTSDSTRGLSKAELRKVRMKCCD